MYETIVLIHVATFIFNIFFVVVSDFKGLLWVLGKKETLSARWMMLFHRLIWAGLTVSVLTGAYLFWGAREYLLTQPAFLFKAGMVGALIINSFSIDRHLGIATTRPFRETNKSERFELCLSGGISTVAWVSVVVAAQFLGL